MFGVAALRTGERKWLTTLLSLSEHPFVERILNARDQQMPTATAMVAMLHLLGFPDSCL